MAEAGIGSREGKGPALREGPAERHSMSLPTCTDVSPPATVFLRKCSRCPFPPPTCHGFPARVFQVSHPAAHLARNPCESVAGVSSCRPPGTESLRKRGRCLLLPSTWHGISAKVFQVSFSASHLPRFSCKSVPGSTSCRPPATVFLQKCSR